MLLGTIRLEVTGTSYDKSGADLEIIILQARCMAEGVASLNKGRHKNASEGGWLLLISPCKFKRLSDTG